MSLRRDAVVLAALAMATHFAYFVASAGDFFFPDSVTYIVPARGLLAGLGFMTRPGVFETLRTPGYPVFLLPFLALSRSVIPIIVFQHLMAVAIVVFTYRMALPLLGRRVAFIAAAILAVDTPSIHFANKVLSETLFTAVLLGLFAIALEMVRANAPPSLYAIAGILTGLLTIIRPVAILYFAVLALLMYRRERTRAVAVFVIASLLLPIGWGIRNAARSGVFTLSSVAGVNMLLHRAAGSLAILDDYDFKEALADRQSELLGVADDEIQAALHVPDAEELSQAVRSSWYGGIGRRIALEHPFGLALLTVRGFLVNLLDSDWEAITIVSAIHNDIVRYVVVGWTHLVAILAILGMIALWIRHRSLALLLIATASYFLIISAGSEAEARFRVPVMPMISIAAAAGADLLRRALASQTE